MKKFEKAFIFKFLLDELTDLISGLIMSPLIILAKIIHPLLTVLK